MIRTLQWAAFSTTISLVVAMIPIEPASAGDVALDVTSFTGPDQLTAGTAGSYTGSLQNPNADYDTGFLVHIVTEGVLVTSGPVATDATSVCATVPKVFELETGQYRCVGATLKPAGSTSLTATLRATGAGTGRVNVFAAPLGYSPITGPPDKTIVVTVTAAGAATVLPMVAAPAKGDRVRAIQALLNHHGDQVSEDGDFGPQTESAVRSLQQSRLLTVDGEVGPQTWPALVGNP